ncbi:hypothetical protein GCM10017600_07930 [Streptosporangium carneum]|uniref:Uncharacterized protein n=1 Tax=Streptosporangium carneum TaxID=47481 RepID=A0A9W6HXG4_9ACTN|nr:hypothetical protein GCM10017600_07930 [Streptosporangium carneum]
MLYGAAVHHVRGHDPVTCSPHERFLPPITLTLASLRLREAEQASLPRTLASRTG